MEHISLPITTLRALHMTICPTVHCNTSEVLRMQNLLLIFHDYIFLNFNIVSVQIQQNTIMIISINYTDK